MRIATQSELDAIYTDPKMRNTIAHAHACLDQYHNHKHYRAMNYPDDFAVTIEQINEAKGVLQADKNKALAALGNKLVFVGMGMQYAPRFDDDVCNHRIRTTFKNSVGHLYFIEVGTGRDDSMRVDHSIDRNLDNEYTEKLEEAINNRELHRNDRKQWRHYQDIVDIYLKQPYNNYKGLERRENYPKYTLQNVMKFVNDNFNCLFTEIEVDNYTLWCDEFICTSPKK